MHAESSWGDISTRLDKLVSGQLPVQPFVDPKVKTRWPLFRRYLWVDIHTYIWNPNYAITFTFKVRVRDRTIRLLQLTESYTNLVVKDYFRVEWWLLCQELPPEMVYNPHISVHSVFGTRTLWVQCRVTQKGV